MDDGPLLLSVNPWKPHLEHLRLFVGLKDHVAAGGTAVVAVRHHLAGAQDSNLASGSQAHEAVEDLLAVFGMASGGIRARIKVTSWEEMGYRWVFDPELHRFLSRVSPFDAPLETRRNRKPGVSEYWTTAVDCFLATQQGSPFVYSDEERSPFRLHCMKVLRDLKFRAPEVTVLPALPKWNPPLLPLPCNSRFRSSTETDLRQLNSDAIQKLTKFLLHPVESALGISPRSGSVRGSIDERRTSVFRERIRAIENRIMSTLPSGRVIVSPSRPAVTLLLSSALKGGEKAVFQVFLARHDWLTQAEVEKRLRAENPSVGVTIWRWLGRLVEAGLIQRRENGRVHEYRLVASI